VNELCCKIKYLDLYLPLDFSRYVLVIINDFFLFINIDGSLFI
jgi:hypothetical protein